MGVGVGLGIAVPLTRKATICITHGPALFSGELAL